MEHWEMTMFTYITGGLAMFTEEEFIIDVYCFIATGSNYS